MNNPNQGNRYEKLPVWHEPKSLVALLKELSSNDSVLKYTTHSWGNERDLGIFKDLSEFLGVANEQYRKLTSYSFYLNNTLNAKIWAFLFNKEVSKDGWAMETLKNGFILAGVRQNY
jgi:RNA-directed DNA polymerase